MAEDSPAAMRAFVGALSPSLGPKLVWTSAGHDGRLVRALAQHLSSDPAKFGPIKLKSTRAVSHVGERLSGRLSVRVVEIGDAVACACVLLRVQPYRKDRSAGRQSVVARSLRSLRKLGGAGDEEGTVLEEEAVEGAEDFLLPMHVLAMYGDVSFYRLFLSIFDYLGDHGAMLGHSLIDIVCQLESDALDDMLMKLQTSKEEAISEFCSVRAMMQRSNWWLSESTMEPWILHFRWVLSAVETCVSCIRQQQLVRRLEDEMKVEPIGRLLDHLEKNTGGPSLWDVDMFLSTALSHRCVILVSSDASVLALWLSCIASLKAATTHALSIRMEILHHPGDIYPDFLLQGFCCSMKNGLPPSFMVRTLGFQRPPCVLIVDQSAASACHCDPNVLSGKSAEDFDKRRVEALKCANMSEFLGAPLDDIAQELRCSTSTQMLGVKRETISPLDLVLQPLTKRLPQVQRMLLKDGAGEKGSGGGIRRAHLQRFRRIVFFDAMRRWYSEQTDSHFHMPAPLNGDDFIGVTHTVLGYHAPSVIVMHAQKGEQKMLDRFNNF